MHKSYPYRYFGDDDSHKCFDSNGRCRCCSIAVAGVDVVAVAVVVVAIAIAWAEIAGGHDASVFVGIDPVVEPIASHYNRIHSMSDSFRQFSHTVALVVHFHLN